VELVAVEENTAIYAWANDESPPVTPGTPVVYDPTNHPIVQGVISAESRWIDDPTQRLTFKYDYTGTAESGEFSRDITFKLNNTSGAIGSGITWTFTILTGGINSLTSASGAQSMSGAGTGHDDCFDARHIRGEDPSLGCLQRPDIYEGHHPCSRGRRAAGKRRNERHAGFKDQRVLSSFNSTSFASVSGSLSGTTPAGVTAVNVNVTLDATPD
jgi:hypothetical protein